MTVPPALRRPLTLLASVLLCLATPPSVGRSWAASGDSFTQIGNFPYSEGSGVVASRRYPGVLWVERDSGSGVRTVLYAFRVANGALQQWPSGGLFKEFPVPGTSNIDWEDIAIDDAGHLYIGDIGNNGGDRTNLRVYKVAEPDPYADTQARVLATYPYTYPGGSYNAESLFFYGGTLYIVDKRTSAATLYKFASLTDGQSQQLVRVGTVTPPPGGFSNGQPLTGDDLSTDGRTLALENQRRVYIYRGANPEDAVTRPPTASYTHDANESNLQVEAVCFLPGSNDIYTVQEQGPIRRIATAGSPTPDPTPAPVPLPLPLPVPPPVTIAAPPGLPPAGSLVTGYWMVGADGRVFTFGAAAHHGEPAGSLGSAVAVDLEPTPSLGGYWVLDDGGRVHARGDARHRGEVARLAPGERATSLSVTGSGGGYWVFTTRGRVFPFGDAVFFGDLAATALNGPVVDSVVTPTGRGYYMVAADGGVFTFGDARFAGSMGDRPLNAPVRSLVPDGDGSGYWLVASDGGVFSFHAPFRGSMGAVALNAPVTGMIRFGEGYLMVGEDGGIFNFSSRPFLGSLGDRPPARPVVAVAGLA